MSINTDKHVLSLSLRHTSDKRRVDSIAPGSDVSAQVGLLLEYGHNFGWMPLLLPHQRELKPGSLGTRPSP